MALFTRPAWRIDDVQIHNNRRPKQRAFQDTSAYGLDLGYAKSDWRDTTHETRFADLAAALGGLGA